MHHVSPRISSRLESERVSFVFASLSSKFPNVALVLPLFLGVELYVTLMWSAYLSSSPLRSWTLVQVDKANADLRSTNKRLKETVLKVGRSRHSFIYLFPSMSEAAKILMKVLFILDRSLRRRLFVATICCVHMCMSGGGSSCSERRLVHFRFFLPWI